MAKTAQVFYDVTQCLGIKDSEYFFALINRESRFQITAESHTGASCYGQLTGIAIADINQRFLEPYKRSDNENCAKVLNHFQDLPTQRTGKYSYRKPPVTRCTAHSNPYSCLFYSAIYYKEALKRAEKLVRDMDMILVKVKGQKGYWIFRNQAQYDAYFKGKDKTAIVDEKRISLLQNKKLSAHVIAMTAYNGGPSVEGLFKKYINQIKGRIWHPTHQQSILSMLFSKDPWGIPPGDFVDSFSESIREQGRSEEVVNYAKNVFNDYENISRGLSPACGALPAEKIRNPERQYKKI